MRYGHLQKNCQEGITKKSSKPFDISASFFAAMVVEFSQPASLKLVMKKGACVHSKPTSFVFWNLTQPEQNQYFRQCAFESIF
jgi:hypothetical protein